MDEQEGSHRRPGWGLPRPGTAAAAGPSWEGEGRQARPEPPRRGRGWRALLVVALGLLLGGGALLLADRAEDDEPPAVAERVEQETADAEPGACLATLPGGDGAPLDVVDCEQQHLGEVVGVLDLGDGGYPGEVAVLSQARDRCTEAFTQYVGAAPEDSELGLLPVVPREGDWLVEGDRTVVCVAEGPALVGSVRGSGR